MAPRIRHQTTNQGIEGSSPSRVNIFGELTETNKNVAPSGGLDPPIFRLTLESASHLRHGGISLLCYGCLDIATEEPKSAFLFPEESVLMCPRQTSLSSVRYGLVVRIPGSHPGGPGSIPGTGNLFGDFQC